MSKAGMDQQDDLGARVAALELLVEQLILERVMMTDNPAEAVRLAMEGATHLASDQPDVPVAAIRAMADVLERVMNRLGKG